jgi:type II restriction/modification system DNA methylase subunit YeeA
MQLIPQVPTKSLQLAHLRQNLIRKDVDTFKANVSALLQRVETAENNNEREDNFKILVLDFLKETYYNRTNEVNTRGNYDLVIHQDLGANSPVSVIFEVKRPSNNAEMISVQNPNTKALQELLHYFLQESFINENKEIKHLIITNIYEWYIFDAVIFEKIFFENKKIVSQYKNWKEGKFGLPQTDWLYQNFLKPFIENELGEIPCAYFNLKDYKEIVQKIDEEEDKKLISLYKIFSPAHLLKHSFVNDANTLNTSFYFELLHILGLEEVKDSGKKIIQRKKKPESGSLIENVLQEIIHRKRLPFASNLKQYGDNEEEQLFSVALELCITWLNRILFLKLLEGQMVKYSPNNRKFLDYENLKDFDELNELFFDVLAIPVEERNMHAKAKFENIPYLNSSLFDETELEANVLSITGLKNRLEMNVYAQTVLKDAQDKKVIGRKNTLEYLFHFLNSYDFSGDSEEIQSDNKTLINSAVLGLIFEKINGYKDGSFFTPAYISMYMCRETIRKAAVQKFNEKYNWKCENFEDLKDNIEFTNKTKRKEANEIVNSVKICDPSVGSGHFLVSALNELVAIKSELKILSHRDGSRIIEYLISLENDEIIITDAETNKPFEYRLNQNKVAIPSLQIIQEAIFSEKKIIIENCLFGVDINPKSVAICRLRLWIELLKNMYYTKESNFKELETLPNIDINIKWGNSLISRFGLGNAQNLLPKDRIFVKKLIDDYKIQVIAYKSEKDWSAKNVIRQQIVRIKSELEKFAAPNDKDFAELRKKEAELGQSSFAFDEKEREKQLKLTGEVSILRQKYTEKLQTLYKNTLEWRFDFPEVLDEEGNFVGFDVVIGNPPYIRAEEIRHIKPFLEANYQVYNSLGDLLTYFFECGHAISNKMGNISFIVSNAFFKAAYGKELKRYLLENTKINCVIEFDKMNIFKEATVKTAIISLSKNEPKDSFIYANIYNPEMKNLIQDVDNQSIQLLQSTLNGEQWTFENISNSQISQKIAAKGIPLSEWDIKINFGLKTGYNKAFLVNETTRNYLISQDAHNEGIIKPLFRGREIQKYYSELQHTYLICMPKGFTHKKHENILSEQKAENLFLKTNSALAKYLSQYKEDAKKRRDKGDFWWELRACDYYDAFEKPKIIWKRVGSHLRFCYDETGIYTLDSTCIAVGSHLKYLTALLNSTLIEKELNRFAPKTGTGDLIISVQALNTLKIPIPTQEEENEFNLLIDNILSEKKVGNDSSFWEKEIDKLVYKLYDLTDEEIAIIEGL